MYFGFEDDHVNAVLADVRKNDATGQLATATTGGLVDIFFSETFSNNFIVADSLLKRFRYKLVVTAPEPKKIASPTIANIQVLVFPSIFYWVI